MLCVSIVFGIISFTVVSQVTILKVAKVILRSFNYFKCAKNSKLKHSNTQFGHSRLNISEGTISVHVLGVEGMEGNATHEISDF